MLRTLMSLIMVIVYRLTISDEEEMRLKRMAMQQSLSIAEDDEP